MRLLPRSLGRRRTAITARGDLEARNCSITYRHGGKKLAEAMIHRDLEGLRAEVAFERAIGVETGPSMIGAASSKTASRAA